MNDKFSMGRLMMLARFYRPVAMKFVYFTLACILLAYPLCWISAVGRHVTFFSLVSMLAIVPFYAAPLLFARYSDRTLTTSLPATWIEKSVFALVYCFVFIPLVMAVSWYLLVGVVSFFTANADPMTIMQSYVIADMSKDMPALLELPQSGFLNSISNAFPVMVGLYAVISARRAKMLFGILAELATLAVYSTASGIYAFVVAFRRGFQDAMNGVAPDPDAIASDIVHVVSDIIVYLTPTGLALMLVAGVMVVRKIKNLQA